MNSTFQEYLDKFIVVLIDDILIYLRSHEKHEKHLRIVLQRLKKKQLYAKFNKYEFWLDWVVCLGYVVIVDGTTIDLSKIEAILD